MKRFIDIFNGTKLHKINLEVSLQIWYGGGNIYVQKHIDAEGCGAVFCAARLTDTDFVL